jgi:endonuclease/exonuclease/phosphatase family metal-dependent hydrolase
MALRRVASDWQIQGPPQFTRFHESAPSRRVLEGDGMSRKGYHTFVVVDGTTNRSTRIYNTHLQSQYEEKGREYFTIRARQSEQILLAIEPDASVIVAGDFNTAPLGLDRQIYDVLAQALQDGTAAFREMCPTCGTHFAAPDHNGLRDPNGSWIDYTFYSSADGDDLTLAAFDRLTLQVYDAPSDHHGLHTMFLVDGPAQDTPASD